MKKTMLFFAALIALTTLSSCEKELLYENPSTATGVTEFTATIEQPTKTAVAVDGKVTWVAGDEITVTDAASNSAVYVAVSSGASTTFTLKDSQTAVGNGPYTATYGDITKQLYDVAGANCPLTASKTSTFNLTFSSPYAVVKVTAKSETSEVIKSVSVTYGSSKSELVCPDGVTLTSDGVDFFIAVQPASEAALSVTFYTAAKFATKTRKSTMTLAAKDLLHVVLPFTENDWKVEYIDASGARQAVNNVTEIVSASDNVTWDAGWYVVAGSDVQLSGGAVCNGAVNLILADGVKLTATGLSTSPGIKVSGEGNSLTIYGQTNQTGHLIAIGGTPDSALGGAGIGGGAGNIGSNITINGGTVSAAGGYYAAGIGGGYLESGSNITINGGTVSAAGGFSAAGIGGGYHGSGSNITINGGFVAATGGGNGAGIGGGSKGSGSNVVIKGGTIIASGGSSFDSGIGNGFCVDGDPTFSNIKVATSLAVKADNNNPPTTVIENDGSDIANKLAYKQYVTITDHSVTFSYVDIDGELRNVMAAPVVDDANTQVTWNAGWYVVTVSDVQFSGGLVCNGAVNLILADGAKLTATSPFDGPGIKVSGEGNSLTIYGQTNQSGQLIAIGCSNGAGIGGGWDGSGSNITINGGIITATGGGDGGAGIGGGYLGSGSNITINGGRVSAAGGGDGAGIGGGCHGSGSNITINGGRVSAAGGGGDGAGIGGGYHGSGSNIIVTTSLVVKADNNNPPTAEIENDGSDVASSLAQKRYVTVDLPAVGDKFVDKTSGLKFEITVLEGTKTVKVIPNDYTNTSYTVPSTVSHYGETFTVTAIGEEAFFYSGLQSINIPETVTEIYSFAFCLCESLESITLPETLLTIGEGAFSSSGLKSISIPETVTEIPSSAFNYCESLESITLPETLTTIGEGAFSSSGLKSISIPETVTEIPLSAFSGCASLESITLPETLLTIGEGAFSSSGLKSINIPETVTEISSYAFADCESLHTVTFFGNACQDGIAEYAFENVGNSSPATLVLPDNWSGNKPDKDDGSWYGGRFVLPG